jgi:hypothetical protein
MLRKIWHRWQAFGRWLGDQIARVVLVVFHFTVALPFGLLVRLTQDPLEMKSKTGAGWTARTTKDRTLKDAERSY